MVTNATQAAQVYNSVARQLNAGGEKDNTVTPEGFGGLVKNAKGSTADMGKKAEMKASELAAGRADIVELVTAVAETEVAVETMVTVRDRVISAYQEILNMPI